MNRWHLSRGGAGEQGRVQKAWQGGGEGQGGSEKQRHISLTVFFFKTTHSGTPPGTVVFYSDWEMQGHQKLRAGRCAGERSAGRAVPSEDRGTVLTVD